LPPLEVVTFVGAMREIGGEITQRQSAAGGLERHVATLLPAARVAAILADLAEPGTGVRTVVRADDELEASVVVMTSSGPIVDHRLDGLVAAASRREEVQA
jgi:hypothetical protein